MDDDLAIESTAVGHAFHGNIHVSGPGLTVLGNVYDARRVRGTNLESQVEATFAKAAILKALKFEGINVRKTAIPGTEQRCFEWVWRSNFRSWLRSDDSLFWITGKPGSGKSTLVKHLADSRRTRQVLEENGRSWLVLHFFFDAGVGKGMANSVEGLLRSLLLQMCLHSDTISLFLEDLTQSGNLDNRSTPELLDALCSAIQRESRQFCVFVDGLDEYEGSLPRLITLLFQLAEREHPAVKICLASRDVCAARNRLQQYEPLVMENNNLETIMTCLHSMNEDLEAEGFVTCPLDILEEIAETAEGVILWARFAFEHVVEGRILQQPPDELRIRARDLPRPIDGVYDTIVAGLSPASRIEAALYLLFLSTASNSVVTTIDLKALIYAAKVRFPLLIHITDGLTQSDFEQRLFDMLGGLVVFLDTDLMDLLQDFSITPYSNFEYTTTLNVRPIHKTLSTYLSRSSWYDSCLRFLNVGSNPANFVLSLYAESRGRHIVYTNRQIEGLPYRDLDRGIMMKSSSFVADCIYLFEHPELSSFHQTTQAIDDWTLHSIPLDQNGVGTPVFADLQSLLVFRGFQRRLEDLFESYG